MAKYKFRLESLQRIRNARRDQQRNALADAFRAEKVLAESQAELVGEEAELRVMQRSAAGGRYLDVNRLLEAQRYDVVLRARAQDIARRQALLAAETEKRRQALVEADRDVRVLELLDERHRREHRRQTERREIRQLDEAAAVRRSIKQPAETR